MTRLLPPRIEISIRIREFTTLRFILRQYCLTLKTKERLSGLLLIWSTGAGPNKGKPV